MSQERGALFVNGWLFLLGEILLWAILFLPAVHSSEFLLVTIPVLLVLAIRGHHIIQPNNAAVCTLLGHYTGSIRHNGFVWTNPFYSLKHVSLRLRSLEGAILKVNDKSGNPIEIGAIVVWQVDDTARATFDVENFAKFVELQSESALRHLANSYAYDVSEHNEVTLRSGTDQVSQALQSELGERLSKAGVKVAEARIAHLVYAPEIAAVMLRRQQAEAVISARRQIVTGAVSIVTSALKELAETNCVELDEERKAAMVSNLLVVLCSENQVSPVINTGTLYT